MKHHGCEKFVGFKGQPGAMLSLVGLLLSATGCYDGTSDSQIGVGQAELSAGDCGSVPLPNVTRFHSIEPAVVSPRTYDTCDKGYVIDLWDLDSAYAGCGDATCARIVVDWADIDISAQAYCQASKVAAKFYVYEFGAPAVAVAVTGGMGGSWVLLEEREVSGTWTPGHCSFDGVSLQNPVAGTSYRIAAQALGPLGNTRRVSVQTVKPFWLR